jgi:hypothetical protein
VEESSIIIASIPGGSIRSDIGSFSGIKDQDCSFIYSPSSPVLQIPSISQKLPSPRSVQFSS